MGPNIIYERRASNMSDSTTSLPDSNYSGSQDRRPSQKQLSRSSTHHQDPRNGSYSHDSRAGYQHEYGNASYLQDSRSGFVQEKINGEHFQDNANARHLHESRNNDYHQGGRNTGNAQELRSTDSPSQHFERLPAEQEKQKFLLNNALQWTDCHPDVKRKLNEMFFRGADLRYSGDATVRVAGSLGDNEECYLR